MAADFNGPAPADGKIELLQTIRDNQDAIATSFDGDPTATNKPVGTKRIDSDGTAYIWNGTSWDLLGYVSLTPALNNGTSIGETNFGDGWIELNIEGTGDRDSYVDFWSHGATADYDARIIRTGGANGGLLFEQKGTGAISFSSIDGADFVFNPGLTDANLIAYGTSSSDLILWDASAARLGINTTSPAYKLDVNGDARFSSGIKNTTINNSNSIDGAALQTGSVPASALAAGSSGGWRELWINLSSSGDGSGSNSSNYMAYSNLSSILTSNDDMNLILHINTTTSVVDATWEIRNKNVIFVAETSNAYLYAIKAYSSNIIFSQDTGAGVKTRTFHLGGATNNNDSKFVGCRVTATSFFSPNPPRMQFYGNLTFQGCHVHMGPEDSLSIQDNHTDFVYGDSSGSATINVFEGSHVSIGAITMAYGGQIKVEENSTLTCATINIPTTFSFVDVFYGSRLYIDGGITCHVLQADKDGSVIMEGNASFGGNAAISKRSYLQVDGTLTTTSTTNAVYDSTIVYSTLVGTINATTGSNHYDT